MNQLTVKFLIGDSLDRSIAQKRIAEVAFEERFAKRYACQILTDRLSFDMLTSADAVACPGNTFGIMSGGLDKAIADLLPHVDIAVRAKVATRPVGELPVGSAIRCSAMDYASPDLPAKGVKLPTILYVPTMRNPEPLPKGTDVPYLAMAATLSAIQERNYRGGRHVHVVTSVIVPLFAAGTGEVPPEVALKQMLLALEISTNTTPTTDGVHAMARERNKLIAQTWVL